MPLPWRIWISSLNALMKSLTSSTNGLIRPNVSFYQDAKLTPPDTYVPDCVMSLWCLVPAAAAAEVEGLKAALKKAEAEAAKNKAAAEKAVAELEVVKTVD